jgi:hypothetical protein
MNAQCKKIDPRLRRRYRRQYGASLLEGLAYLAVAAIVIVGAIAMLGSALTSANSNRVAEELSTIKIGTEKLFMGQVNGYGTASLNPVLIAAGVFPATLSTSGGTVTDEWGGTVTVTGTGSAFTVAYTKVPVDVCVSALTAGGTWASVAVGSGTALPYPVSPTTASQSCTDAATITWTSD